MAFQCCFCGKSGTLDSRRFGVMTLRIPAYDAEAAQDLYCHGSCLRERVTPKFLLLFDDAEQEARDMNLP